MIDYLLSCVMFLGIFGSLVFFFILVGHALDWNQRRVDRARDYRHRSRRARLAALPDHDDSTTTH